MSAVLSYAYNNCLKYLNFVHDFLTSADDYHQCEFAQIIVFNAVQHNCVNM